MLNEYDEDQPEEYSGPFVVCLFLLDQAYGGPEEGGWYYTYGDPVLTTHLRAFTFYGDAREYLESLDPVVDGMNHGRPSISSVASQGRFKAMICEGWPKPFPDKIPRYS